MSTQSRVIAIGALAVVWAVLSGDADDFKPNIPHLLGLAVASLGVLTIDFLQYLAGYGQQRFRLKAIQHHRDTRRAVRFLFNVREICFHLKWILVIITSVLLIRTAISTLSQKPGAADPVSKSSSPILPMPR
jgi:hypothetical protein